MNNKKHSLFSLLLCFLFLSSFSLSAQDFEVAPVVLNYDCEPGQIQTKVMTIRNHSSQTQQFVLTIADVKTDSSIAKKGASNPRSCKDWLSVNPSFFDLNPNETKEVKVVLQVPPNEMNTRGAMIYVSATEEKTSLAADKQLKTGVKVTPRIGVKVTQSPRSNTNYQAKISELKEVTAPKDSARTFQVKLTNTGDKVIDYKVLLVLSNLTTAKEIKTKPVKASIFPGNSKVVRLYMPANVPAGKYSLAAILDYGNNSALEAAQMNVEVK